jgi:phosphatidylglycerophosphate synthase
MKKTIPPVKELYQQVSKNVLNPNTSFTSELWYSRIFGRKVSIYFTWVFLKLGINEPNHVTLISLIPALFGSAFLAIPSIWNTIVGFLIFNLYIFIDSSDGEIARYTNKKSEFGRYLDGILHIFIYAGLYIALGANIYLRNFDSLWLLLGIFTAFLFTAASFIHHTYPLQKKKSYFELRKKDSALIYYGINVYNFLTGDLEIFLFLFLFAPLQYLGIIELDLFKIILLLNAFLILFGGILYNVYKKFKENQK